MSASAILGCGCSVTTNMFSNDIISVIPCYGHVLLLQPELKALRSALLNLPPLKDKLNDEPKDEQQGDFIIVNA